MDSLIFVGRICNDCGAALSMHGSMTQYSIEEMFRRAKAMGRVLIGTNEWHDVSCPCVASDKLLADIHANVKDDTMKPNHDYNGYANYETWNIALWISNDIKYYTIAKKSRNYAEFLTYLDNPGDSKTPDGVLWSSAAIQVNAIDELIREINNERTCVCDNDGMCDYHMMADNTKLP